MAPPSFEETMARIAEQHRQLLEAHGSWVQEVTSAAVQDLVTENQRLSAELSAMKSFVLGKRHDEKSPPIPKLPVSLADAPPAAQADATQAAPTLDKSFAQAEGEELRHIARLSSSSCGFELPGMVAHAASLESRSARSLKGRWGPARSTAACENKENKFEAKERRRLRAMFRLRPDDAEVQLEVLLAAITRRLPRSRSSWFSGPDSGLASLLVFADRGAGFDEEMLSALRALDLARQAVAHSARPHFSESWLSDTGFALDGLMQVIGPDLALLMQHVPPEDEEGVLKLAQALDMTTTDDVIDEASRGTFQVERKGAQTGLERIESIVNACVVAVVVVNVLALGASIDFYPDHRGWFALETVCAAVFIAEVAFKIWAYGMRSYFSGPVGHWNLVDFFITLVSVVELAMSSWILAHGRQNDSREAQITTFTRLMVFMRTVRVIRVIRLVKLLHSPLLRDLANMLAGFVIGMPALVWVLAVFGFVLYILALIFRIMLGPAPGQDLMFGQGCGWGDDLVDLTDDICKIHYLYGEEFFGDVSSSMFTVFRFMLGDYATRGGKSMLIAMQYGYGTMFEVVFVSFMVVVIFGLFNIITAIFVDSTTAGLKHNDIKRKYVQQYEREFVKAKLQRLVERIHCMVAESPGLSAQVRRSAYAGALDSSSLLLEEEAFGVILLDPIVQEIMRDLDVTVHNPAGLFDTFDADGDGAVTIFEFVQVVMKLRGEPHKTDIIGCAVSIRSLQRRFDELNARLDLVLEPGMATAATQHDEDCETIADIS